MRGKIVLLYSTFHASDHIPHTLDSILTDWNSKYSHRIRLLALLSFMFSFYRLRMICRININHSDQLTHNIHYFSMFRCGISSAHSSSYTRYINGQTYTATSVQAGRQDLEVFNLRSGV